MGEKLSSSASMDQLTLYTKKSHNIYIHQNMNKNAFSYSYIVFQVMHDLKLFKVNY